MAPQSPKASASFRADGNLAIHVPDLAKAAAFYEGVLGFRLVARSADLLHFDAGAIQLYVKQDIMVRPFIPALQVPDYAAAKRHLEAAGCRVIHEWDGSRAFYFEDPFGLVIDVIERRR